MNKLTKFSRAILAIAIMLCVALPTLAHDFEVDGIYYNFLDKTAKTVKVTYKGNSTGAYSDAYTGNVTIPSSVTYSGTTFSVTSIGYLAFAYCTGLTSVTIPNSVTSIGDYAFYGCTGLTSVTIPNSVTYIGDYAFNCCKGLTSVTIPNSVTYIGSNAFSSCSGLTSVIVENGNRIYDSRDNCNAIVIASTNTLVVGCKNTIIPNSVTSIGYSAFYGCTGLTSITIPNSVTSIGNYAFNGTAWYNNLADGVIYINNVLYKYKGSMPNGTSISVKDGTVSISPTAFRDCTGLISATIPNSVTSIGSNAFEDCTGLTSVNITDLSAWCKIDFGDSYANPLHYANKLKLNGAEIKDLVIPNDITKIKDYAFYNCDGLTEVTIPNSVTEIGSSAFRGCSGLTSVTIPNSVTEIGGEAFVNCGLRLIMSHCAVPPTCAGDVFGGDENNDSYRALLMIPEGSLIDYALADEWHKFTQVHEVSEATVSTQEKNATFEIPTIEGATKYYVTVYTDITMTQLVATTHYDATGKIIPMSTTLELSIDGFEDGVYYYKVLVKSADGEVLNNYIGTFEIDAAGVENIATDNAIEVARYDIHGRLLNEPTPGINIVKMSNGTTRKEIVKN